MRQALQHSHAKIPPTPIEAARRVPNAAHIGSLREEASAKKTPPTPDVTACHTHTQFNRTCLHTVHKLSRPSHPNLLQAWRTIEVLKAQVLLRLQEWLLKLGAFWGGRYPSLTNSWCGRHRLNTPSTNLLTVMNTGLSPCDSVTCVSFAKRRCLTTKSRGWSAGGGVAAADFDPWAERQSEETVAALAVTTHD